MQVRQFRYSSDNLGYLVYGRQSAVAVDGGAVEAMAAFVNERGLNLDYVTNTHSHPDHRVGNQGLLERSAARFLDFETLMADGAVVIDGERLNVMHTPGPTQDSVCFYFNGVLLSGDTLFNGKVGRCFTGDAEAFFESIRKILAFPDDTWVYAGHDYVEEYLAFARSLEPDNPHIDAYLEKYDPAHVVASLGEEKKVDPFLRFDDEKIIGLLKERGLSVETSLARWKSLLSLM